MRGKKTQRHAVSDWMDIERERGISITSAALEFDLFDRHVTLLDTPGHKDFSEDTYRTLLAVDTVVMVIDAAKGIESQTRKLFEVARQRHLPMLTFVNKLDLPARDPLDLLDEIERVLGVAAVPMNWPIGTGDRFRGVYDLQQQQVLFYERAIGAATGARRSRCRAPTTRSLAELIGEERRAELLEGVHLLAGRRHALRSRRYRAGRADRRLLRLGAVELRPRVVPRGARRARAAAAAARERRRHRRPGGRATSAGSSSRSRRT